MGRSLDSTRLPSLTVSILCTDFWPSQSSPHDSALRRQLFKLDTRFQCNISSIGILWLHASIKRRSISLLSIPRFNLTSLHSRLATPTISTSTPQASIQQTSTQSTSTQNTSTWCVMILLGMTSNHVSIPPNQNGTMPKVDFWTKRLSSAECVRSVRTSVVGSPPS